MTTLVVGASGATGRLLVAQLLQRGRSVRAVLRAGSELPAGIVAHEALSVVRASLADLDDDAMRELVSGCDSIASCLGHNLTFKGVYGHPRRLVSDAARRLCAAVDAIAPQSRVRFVLMNTTGNINPDENERVSFAQTCVLVLLRLLLPPHVDNERAADYLRTRCAAANGAVEWVVVRPDALIDEPQVSAYDEHPSPIRSAIFDSGKTSRINVAHFIAELICDDGKWRRWKGRMPVIYNRADA